MLCSFFLSVSFILFLKNFIYAALSLLQRIIVFWLDKVAILSTIVHRFFSGQSLHAVSAWPYAPERFSFISPFKTSVGSNTNGFLNQID
jgi:hypothetical protein